MSARVVCLSAALAERVDEQQAQLGTLSNAVPVVVGGAAMTPEQASALHAHYLDGDLRRAVRALRRLAA
jgi:cobalamin-dependent methionine synthase I